MSGRFEASDHLPKKSKTPFFLEMSRRFSHSVSRLRPNGRVFIFFVEKTIYNMTTPPFFHDSLWVARLSVWAMDGDSINQNEFFLQVSIIKDACDGWRSCNSIHSLRQYLLQQNGHLTSLSVIKRGNIFDKQGGKYWHWRAAIWRPLSVSFTYTRSR